MGQQEEVALNQLRAQAKTPGAEQDYLDRLQDADLSLAHDSSRLEDEALLHSALHETMDRETVRACHRLPNEAVRGLLECWAAEFNRTCGALTYAAKPARNILKQRRISLLAHVAPDNNDEHVREMLHWVFWG